MRGNACREIFFNPDEAPLAAAAAALRLMTSASDASVEANRGGKMWKKVVPPR